MSDRNLSAGWKALLTLLLVLLSAGNALAYVGPGAGLELVGYFSSLLAWVVMAFSAFMLWPIYSFLHWIRSFREQVKTESPGPAPEGTLDAEPANR